MQRWAEYVGFRGPQCFANLTPVQLFTEKCFLGQRPLALFSTLAVSCKPSAEFIGFLGPCKPCKRTAGKSCAKQSTLVSSSGRAKSPDRDFRAAPGSYCHAQPPNLHTLTFSKRTRPPLSLHNIHAETLFVQQSSAVFWGNMTAFNKNQHFCVWANLGHIFEVAFKSTQTSDLSDKLYQGLGPFAKWK